MSTTGDIRIRVSQQQKEQLKNLAQAHGFRTLSDFVRSKIFEDLSTNTKLNEILCLLKNGEDRLKKIKESEKNGRNKQ